MDNLLKLIFPPKCIVCGNFGSLFCDNCFAVSRKLRRHYPLELPKPYSPLDVFCYFVYERSIRKCIIRAKYSKKQFAVLREVSKSAVLDMQKRKIKLSADYIIPIPLSPKKKRYRGFNQALVVADVVSKAYLIPYQCSILTRQKDTVAQHRLNRKKRLVNIKGAFQVISEVEDLDFLIVDDICTTGATLIEAARVLYEAGARKVTAFTLSKRL